MHEARDGDLVTYQKCTDPTAPATGQEPSTLTWSNSNGLTAGSW